MKKIIKNTIWGAACGISIGLLWSLVFNFAYGSTVYYPSSTEWTQQFHSVPMALLVSILLWAAMGNLFVHSTVIFTSQKFGTTTATALHFVITCPTFTVLAILSGWFPLNVGTIAAFLGEFLLIYIFIAFANHWYYKNEALKLKSKINER